MGVSLPCRLAGPAAIVALIACMTGCASGQDPHSHRDGSAPGASGNGTPSTWLFTERALREVRVDAVVRRQLDGALIFEITGARRRSHTEPGAVPTMKFASYASMKATILSGGLPPWVKAVLYDAEAWPFTPVGEQRAPGRYMALAAELAHRHHLQFVASPALDLASVLAPQTARRASAYLQLRLAAQAAAVADVVDIQAQSLERSAHVYVDFVRRAAADARHARPNVRVLAGISSNPTGPQVSAAQLTRAITGVRPYVDGYWINIPAPGRLCPRCNQPRPELAIAAIRSLSR